MRSLFRCLLALWAVLSIQSFAAGLPIVSDETGSAAYLVRSNPPRIERHTLATGEWQPAIPLPSVPTALVADTNALFLSIGSTLYRQPLDGSPRTTLLTLDQPIKALELAGRFLVFCAGGDLGSLDKETGLFIDLVSHGYPFSALEFSPTRRWVYLVHPITGWDGVQSAYCYRQTLREDGSFGPDFTSVNYLGPTTNAFVRLSPDQSRLFTSSGKVFRTSDNNEDKTLVSFPAWVDFDHDVTVVAQGSNLVAYAWNLEELGRTTLLPETDHIVVNGTNLWAYGHTNGTPVATRIPLAQLGAPVPNRPQTPVTIFGRPDAVFSDVGFVHLFSRAQRSIHRWDISTQKHLPSIPLGPGVTCVASEPIFHIVFVGYLSGRITRIDLSQVQPWEQEIARLPDPVTSLTASISHLLAVSATADRTDYLDHNGNHLSSFERGPREQPVWDHFNARFYLPDPSFGAVRILPAPDRSLLPETTLPIYSPTFGGWPAPFEISPSNTFLLSGDGLVVGLATNGIAAQLGISVTDAAWMGNYLHTLRSIGGHSQIQRWNGAFQFVGGVQLPGSPVALMAEDPFLVGAPVLTLVSLNQHQVQFSQWDVSLQQTFLSPLQPAGLTNLLLQPASIAEDAPVGSLVGTLFAEGSASLLAVHYSMPSGQNVPFELQGSNLVTTALLDYETAPSFQIELVASNALGAVVRKIVSVSVIDRPEPVVTIQAPFKDLFEIHGENKALTLTRSGSPMVPLTVRLKITGPWQQPNGFAVFNHDWPVENNVFTFHFPLGARDLLVSISPYMDAIREEPILIQVTPVPGPEFSFASLETHSFQLWDDPFTRWLILRNGRLPSVEESAESADPDGNGVSNFVEYNSGALAAPTNSYTPPRLAPAPDGQAVSILFQRRNQPEASIERDLLVSTNLTDWLHVVPQETVLETLDDVESVRWTVPTRSASSFFAHLRTANSGTLHSPHLTVSQLGLRMLGLPNRFFMMGSYTQEIGSYPDEHPNFAVLFTHRLWLAETETTQAQYVALMTNNPSWNRGDNLPVDNVTWEEANEFCRRLTRLESDNGRVPPGYAYRLPTEAEWESAARSSEFYSSWVPSGPLQDHAWFVSNSGFHTHPVGTKAENPWGLHDLAGNVGEWCRDWYGPYPALTVVDPKGPVSGLYRVVRGGSFIDGQTALRVAARNGGLPSQPSRFIGFRVVLGVALE